MQDAGQKLREIWDMPVTHAPWSAAILLIWGWAEHLLGWSVPWLWLIPVGYGLLRLPSRHQVPASLGWDDFEPTGAELILACLCVASLMLSLLLGWSRQSSDAMFIYAIIALGLLYLRMARGYRKRNHAPKQESE